jgi:transposase
MKRKDWQAFCREDLAPLLRKGQYIQLDNLDLHYDQEAYEAIHQAGGIFIFQPSYSPESNPIEEAFSHLKRHLRSAGAQLLEELRQAIASGFELILPAHMQAYWQHAQEKVLSW